MRPADPVALPPCSQLLHLCDPLFPLLNPRTPMEILKTYTLWTSFKHLHCPETTNLEVVQSTKSILKHSNIILIYHGILCGMIYQQDTPSGPLNKTSKVILTMSLLIVACNRIQYEGNSSDDLRTRVQQTGPLLPTFRYIIPEFLIIILLVLEAFKAGGIASTVALILLWIILLCLGSNFRNQRSSKDAETKTTAVCGGSA
ncbi:hypothetical protein DL96DRAFT_1817251 [Flagelloscypha sp. PMI_526]|nr:hypothetical protein DL96DRAFT_1817251 [Flagelloscypha sp. PMI_526]